MSKKILTTQHPYFLTWMGTFYKIYRSDKFVLLDNSKLRQGDEYSLWNRNTISYQNQHMKMYIPIFFERNQEANTALIDQNKKWVGKHLSMIEECYKEAPFYSEVFPIVREHYLSQHKKLVDFNIDFIKAVCEYLEIDYQHKLMSELPDYEGGRSNRVMRLCQDLGCDSFLIDRGALNYIDDDKFANKNICVTFVDFKEKFGNFNVLDVLFKEGRGSFNKYLKDVELMTC